jgi:hypothetical protein
MSEAWRGFCHHGTVFLPYTSVAVQGCWRADYKSWYTKYYRKQVRGLDLSRFTKLSKWQKFNAKTVTNLLILLSVLVAVFLIFKMRWLEL